MEVYEKKAKHIVDNSVEKFFFKKGVIVCFECDMFIFVRGIRHENKA